MRKFATAAAIAAATISSAAMALVTFDSTTGTGWVGKGDVQTAFGWNNKAAQDNVNNVAFSAQSEERYQVTCEWTTGPDHNRQTHDVSRPIVRAVSSTVGYEARKTGHWTGYNLTGYGATVGGGAVPTVGGQCPNGHFGTITEVSGGGDEGSVTTLYVSWNGGTPVALN
jgi:hypothetical protein